MAKYESVLTIRGAIDDLQFRKTAEGKIVGCKTGPTREKVLTSPRFANTRKSGAEFKQITKDAKLLRQAMGHLLDGVCCTTLNGRVNGFVNTILQQDQEHRFGERRTAAGDIGLLTGAEFNKTLALDAAIPIQFEHTLDAITGVLTIRLPSFIAYKRKGFPKEATHFRIISGGIAINFDKYTFSRNIKSGDLLPLSRKTPGPICFEHAVKAGTGDALIQVLGIQFFRLENGKEVLVKGGAVRVLEAVPITRMEDELHKLNEATKPQSPFQETPAVAGQVLQRKEKLATFSPIFTLPDPVVNTRLFKCSLHEKVSPFVVGAASGSYNAGAG